jgi:peptidoglycan/LPS O-acetylase OafA/YrhL
MSSLISWNVQCGLVEAAGVASGASKQVEDIIGWGGVPVTYPQTQPMTIGFYLTTACVVIFSLLVIVGTGVDWQRESKQRELLAEAAVPSYVPGAGLETAQPLNLEVAELPPMKTWEKQLQHWSALRNGRSFMRTRTGDKNPFACMDAIRTISMAQVILGHMYVYAMSSSGIANMEQFNPPNGLLGSVWFMMVPGCFYGVDSFFLLSGFLCCHGLQKKVFSKESNRSLKGFSIMYVKFVLLRVLRLLPLEMLCIALCVNVLPKLGTGVLWNLNYGDGHHCFEGAGSGDCTSYWWTNLLFLQDLDQYVGKCFGHTWYLANDMQLYLTAPFFSLAYSYSRRYGWALISIGLLVGIISPMVICDINNIVPDPLLGGAEYSTKVYMKPYCRCTPFFVGIILAWLWQERLEMFNFRHTSCAGRISSYIFSFLAVLICAVCVFGRVVFYNCDIVTCSNLDTNPGGRFALLLWGGFSILGWSIGLGMIMILCFQKRFFPLLQNVLDLPGWQPFAKLSYASYLIHTSVLIIDYCQLDSPLCYSDSQFFFNYVAFVTVTMAAAFMLYILLEKPLANMQAAVFQMSAE